ncbi:hypothetical protein H8K01_13740 [Clostridium perfringens]|uniref:class II lanthipeptide, LchA2/BrtA2 family n=1 Tax=Clostridium perfringens TaxID=1502 RepID=UPI0018E42A21|nr:class II lanthipeptide, LchA2/BrtA2 family [Clostridium perfringens]MBI6030479.1 hypothetical protein [Clostridium perfringens]MBI6033673.1 hypothetical protein [Clostridium perfringens]
MKNNEICKNAGFINEDELVELVDANDVNGGTWAAAASVAATVTASTAVGALFTVTSACTKKCK